MTVTVDVQIAPEVHQAPEPDLFRAWVAAALAGRRRRASVSIRVAGRDEMSALNDRFRGRSGPTNVLSFPADLPPGVSTRLLGDVVICAPVVAQEAAAQGKPPVAHWAHLVVHGTLHLIGYDHQEPAAARAMETLETAILRSQGFADPYRVAS